jgi:dihydropteroate synthase
MGILNVTPDSFSDGGLHLASDDALLHLRAMAGAGAAIIDVGAESTRPGAARVPASEQRARLSPLFAALGGAPPVPISIDTTRVAVAEAALDAGATVVNDVSAGREEPEILDLVAERRAGVVLMHMRGEPGTMQEDPRYDDVVGEVVDFLGSRAAVASERGVDPSAIAVDPGIGFGKTLDHNLALLRGLRQIVALGHPVVVGVSRKSMLGVLTDRPAARDRLAGSLAAALAAVAAGAALVRAHDVRDTVDALAVWGAVHGGEESR